MTNKIINQFLMKNIFSVILISVFSLILWSCVPSKNVTKSEISVVPKVNEMIIGKSYFKFTKQTGFIVENENQKKIVRQFSGLIEKSSGCELPVIIDGKVGNNTVSFKTVKMGNPEAYSIQVLKDRIEIQASNEAGFFYALQTLRQLLPSEIESNQLVKNIKLIVPVIKISDSPAFKWRGFMLDVSRHFFPKEDVLRMIDNLALHKINVLQLHLVDQQGWRIEIKKYPKLTEIGAWRVDRDKQPWNSSFKQKPGEKSTYGGFYTQEDIKEMVAYAQQHFITIVPEIEMPAHITSALAAYPQYSCSGKSTTVLPGGFWPINDLYCAGNDSTFLFLQDVLTEVMDLFPSKYIHIGGDEANMSEWEACTKCQKRIHDHGLKNTGELQSYFISRIEKFIHSKNRVLIGWDEILEGGLPPNATIMSWRGVQGGIEAAKLKHDVVMTPGSHCYFDGYQGSLRHEPTAMGGYLPLKKVYHFQPVPPALNADERKFIIGAQANLWTEYISNLKHAEYMTFPRIAALSEVLWSANNTRNWDDFSRRIQLLMKRYDFLNINYSKSAFQVTIHPSFDSTLNKIKVNLEREFPSLDIHYTTDGAEPTPYSNVYTEPLLLSSSTVLKAKVFSGKNVGEFTVKQDFGINIATGKQVKYLSAYDNGFAGRAKFNLVNGIRGSLHYNDEEWQGWNAKDVDVVVDLQTPSSVNSISVGFLQDNGTWMFLPPLVEYYISTDGENFEKVGEFINSENPLSSVVKVKDFSLSIQKTQARYIRIKATNISKIPTGHPLEGQNAWLFVDEISVK